MTKPYYQDDLITLYLGDCLEVLDWLDADVLVTDPPYGIGGNLGFNGNKGGLVHERQDWDDTLDVRDRVLELWGDRPRAVFGSPKRIVNALGDSTVITRGDARWLLLATALRQPNGFTTTATYTNRGLLATSTAVNPYRVVDSPTTRYVWNGTFDQVDTIATPTGEGLTRPRTFSRVRRLTVAGGLRIV